MRDALLVLYFGVLRCLLMIEIMQHPQEVSKDSGCS